MKNHSLIIEDDEAQLLKAISAENAGNYLEAYKLYSDLWQSDFWSESSHDLIHYADMSEQVGDYTRALDIYTALMDSTTLDLDGVTSALIQTSLDRLHKKEKLAPKPAPTEKFADAEIAMVKKLYKIGHEKLLEEGDFICEAGDLANHMWLLVEGEIEVQVSNISMDVLSGTESNPCLLGEVAYFTGLRRAASLRCLTKVKLIEISYHDLGALELKDHSFNDQLDLVFKSRLGRHLLSQHDICKKLKDEEREFIATSFVHIDVEPGKILVDMKLPRDECILVQSGTLMMLKENIFGELEYVTSMHPGDIVNITGLLKGYRPPYRIITGTSCRLLVLSAKQFVPVLENNPQLIKEILEITNKDGEQQILRPHKADLWAGNRNIDVSENLLL